MTHSERIAKGLPDFYCICTVGVINKECWHSTRLEVELWESREAQRILDEARA